MTDTVPCAHCGDPVQASGRPSKSGLRFCSAKRACIAARQRDYRRRNTEPIVAAPSSPAPEIVLEDRPCSYCRMALPIRPKRSGDNPFGRWCDRYACRRDRQVILTDPARVLPQADIAAAFERADIGYCRTCGRQDARMYFQHPPAGRFYGDGCVGTGLVMPPMRLAIAAWDSEPVAVASSQASQAAPAETQEV